MAEALVNRVKLLSVPLLVFACLAMFSYILAAKDGQINAAQQEIAALKVSVDANARTIAVMSTTMDESRANRQEFQTATITRLDKFGDVLEAMNETVIRLRTLQEARVR